MGDIEALLALFAQQLKAPFAALVTTLNGGASGRLAAAFNLELPPGGHDETAIAQVLDHGGPKVSARGIRASLGLPDSADHGAYTVTAPYEAGSEAGALLLGYEARPAVGERELLESARIRAALCGLCLQDPASFFATIPSLSWPSDRTSQPVLAAGRGLVDHPYLTPLVTHRAPGPHLWIRALGRTEVRCSEGSLEPGWLSQRPGQLLKYLVCRRDDSVSVDDCVEALWPDAGISGRSNVRQAIFTLRSMLEPNRNERGSSSFVITVGGCYALNRHRVEIDVDEFERLTDPRAELSLEALERAVATYVDDFLADEPYAEWAFRERERLRSRADLALRRLATASIEAGDLAAAEGAVVRLALMWPLDGGAHRAQVALCLARGHLSQAQRWYSSFRHRLQRDLEIEPDFSLADLHSEPVQHARRALADPFGPAASGAGGRG